MDGRSDRASEATAARWDIGFGVATLAFALIALFVWFPNDIPVGFMFVNAIGREEPGDAFFPVLLATGLAALGAIQIIAGWSRRTRDAESQGWSLSFDNLRFMAELLMIVAVGLTVMYWLGPLTVAAMNAVGALEGGYRLYSDTPPYKYLGFIAGGFGMTIALIRRTEGRVSPASAVSVALVLLAAIIIFDVLLKNVLLPPNAEF